MKNSTIIFYILFVTIAAVYCNERVLFKEKELKTVKYDAITGTNPKVQIKITKQYDQEGKLVKFDSSYSYHYSSTGRDALKGEADRTSREFKSYHSTLLSNKMNTQLNNLLLNDSLLWSDFLNENRFKKCYEITTQNK